MQRAPAVFLALVAICSALWVAPARAAAPSAQRHTTHLRAANEAMASQDYAKAYRLYMQQRQQALAQFNLGLLHRNGWGRSVDAGNACHWFQRAAEGGIPAAEHYWADCLVQGIGQPADVAAALDWYEKAASHGHLISACTAADYYIQGRGVAKDVERGIAQCTRVAHAHSPPAMLQLADYYREGIHLPQNLVTARYWYQEAAQRQSLPAQYWLGILLAQGQGGAPDVVAALHWLESAASAGYAAAYLPTAVLYANQPLEPQSQALSAEHLAKIYLWTRAARMSVVGDAAELERIEVLLEQVVPATWRMPLDAQVQEHLQRFPPPAAEASFSETTHKRNAS